MGKSCLLSQWAAEISSIPEIKATYYEKAAHFCLTWANAKWDRLSFDCCKILAGFHKNIGDYTSDDHKKTLNYKKSIGFYGNALEQVKEYTSAEEKAEICTNSAIVHEELAKVIGDPVRHEELLSGAKRLRAEGEKLEVKKFASRMVK